MVADVRTVRSVWNVGYNVICGYMILIFYACAIVHTFANMYGAFDVILYYVNPTF